MEHSLIRLAQLPHAVALLSGVLSLASGCDRTRAAVDANTGDAADAFQGLDQGHFDGPAADERSAGTVTFQLLVAPATAYCEQANVCSGAEMHFTVTTADGQALTTATPYTYDGGVSPAARISDCSQPCQPPRYILAVCSSSAASFSGATQTWGGEYSEQLWCDSFVCERTRYAPPGHYVVVMCATPGAVTSASDPLLGTMCAPSGQPSCVKVPFDFPSATPVVGQLPAP